MNTSSTSQLQASSVASVGLSGQQIRRIVLEQSYRARVGHIGSALCIADILAALYGSVLRITNPDDPDRDRFILSKGHAALALYATLFLRGWLTQDQLNSFCVDNSLLGVHPEHDLTGVDFASGSLGQGVTFAAGAALAARMQKSSRRVFVLLSDAECNEGAVWEAIMFAAHHKLSNLIAIVDLNNQQAFGYTKDVLDLSPLSDRLEAFGWDVHEIDGHDQVLIAQAVNSLCTTSGAPHVILAKTTFGKGVSFMENKIKWHYSPLADDEYQTAISEVNQKV